MAERTSGSRAAVASQAVLRPAAPGDAAAIARVHADAAQDAYRDILPAAIVQRFSRDNRAALWRGLLADGPSPRRSGSARAGGRPPLVEVAALGSGEIAGFAWLRRIEQRDSAFGGEIIAVAVAPAWQGLGLGRRLMTTAAARLAGLGAASCYLWVYRDNAAARGFYERLGGRMVDQDVERCEGEELPIVAYAWKPIDRLLAGAGGVTESRP